MGCGASHSNNPVPNVRSTSPLGNNNHPMSSPPRRAPPTAMNTPMASQPVSLPRPYRHGAPITQGEINNMRTEFWQTRTGGNQQMWQTIRSACDALVDQDVALTNAILEAANLMTPNGTLELVYDERGHQYKIPMYCYAKPQELNEALPGSSTNTSSVNAQNPSISSKNSNQNANVPPPAPAPGGTPLKLRMRINPGDYTVNITIDSHCTILHLKYYMVEHGPRENSALEGITVPRQRIIYMGKQLPDTMKLEDAKFDETKVVQVFLKPLPSTN